MYLEALQELDDLRSDKADAERARQLRIRDESIRYWRNAADDENQKRKDVEEVFAKGIREGVDRYIVAKFECSDQSGRMVKFWERIRDQLRPRILEKTAVSLSKNSPIAQMGSLMTYDFYLEGWSYRVHTAVS